MRKLYGVLIIFNTKFSLALEIPEYLGIFEDGVSLGCLYYFHTIVCSQMTSGGDLYCIGTSKLTCLANQWTDSCVMRFLPEGRCKQTMILNLCGSAKYITVLCFSIRGGDTRVPAPSCTWGVAVFLERSLMCWVIIGLWCVFTLVQMRLSDVEKIP